MLARQKRKMDLGQGVLMLLPLCWCTWPNPFGCDRRKLCHCECWV